MKKTQTIKILIGLTLITTMLFGCSRHTCDYYSTNKTKTTQIKP